MTEITDHKDNPTVEGPGPDGRSEMWCLSPDDSALVAEYQRTFTVPTLKDLINVQGTMVHTTVNRRGRRIHNWARFMLSIISSTVSQ